MAEQNNLTLTGLQPLPFNEVPAQLFLEIKDPTSANYNTRPYKNFQVGTFWLNTRNQNLWYLANITTSPKVEGNWVLLSSGVGDVEQLTGNTGVAVPVAGNINVIGSITEGTARTTGAASTLTLSFTDAAGNVGLGSLSMGAISTGQTNTGVGFQNFTALSTGTNNAAFGQTALDLLSSGIDNTAIGARTLTNLSTGNQNTAIGFNAGISYVGAEDSNILIKNTGTVAESHTIRIGTSGAGSGQQNKCFIVGIDGVNVGSVATVVTETSDQLGTAVITAGSGVTITPGANLITISLTGGGVAAQSFPTGGGGATTSGTTAVPTAAGVLNVLGAHNILTGGTVANTISVFGTNTIILGDLSAVAANSPSLTLTTGDAAITAGNITLPVTNSALSVGVVKVGGIRWLHNFGTNNVFIGNNAGNGTLTTGSAIQNTAIGNNNLQALTTGLNNVAIGAGAAPLLSTGSRNFALGTGNLAAATSAASNIIIGVGSGASITSGTFNIAVGDTALMVTSGSRNTIFGNSGSAYTTTESDNILIGYSIAGTATEGNVLRIGNGTGAGNGQLSKSFIAGIRGITTVNNDAIAVLIDSTGQLGTVSSSKRFKDNIKDMADESSALMSLRPVTFTYIADKAKNKHYGLIVEEVISLFPELVANDSDKQPFSVKYHDLPAILLNELQKLAKRVQDLEAKLASLSK